MVFQVLRSISMAVRRHKASKPFPPNERSLDTKVANVLLAAGLSMMGIGGYSIWMETQVEQIREEMWADLQDLERARRMNVKVAGERNMEHEGQRYQETFLQRETPLGAMLRR
eukprot:CAMPEP_0205907862 /NCGR_PEP_ID=MMETSP1325-20131115/2831_1 /ASSEMBLY_ACC=CAM_ASM_000708 /TAXON_ID=236786 /ORGANISM="Florenciella sp., Strain RCC1007" /LENGTH=112 /DNA_ID=CAMNT_0053274009 /DNA_START=133 /DNA_END=471 /DNA_ORIENTATION=+